MTPQSSSEELEIGYVSGVFGVKGEVRLHLHNRESDLFRKGRSVTLVAPSGVRQQVRLRSRSGAGRRILGRIDGFDSRDKAAAIKGHRLVIPLADLPAPEEGEFYVRDVVELPVYVGDEVVGVVVDVHRTGPVDIFEVAVGEERKFVPAVLEFVDVVDIAEGRVVMFPEAFEV